MPLQSPSKVDVLSIGIRSIDIESLRRFPNSRTITFSPFPLNVITICSHHLLLSRQEPRYLEGDVGGSVNIRNAKIRRAKLRLPKLEAMFEGEAAGGKKTMLPGPGQKAVTERPTVKK